MSIGGNSAAKRLGDFNLHRRIHHMVFAANDVSYSELNVIDHGAKGIEIGTVLADQHGVRLRGSVNVRRATNEVVPLHPMVVELEAPVGSCGLRIPA